MPLPTWADLKREIEAEGVKDDDEIGQIWVIYLPSDEEAALTATRGKDGGWEIEA